MGPPGVGPRRRPSGIPRSRGSSREPSPSRSYGLRYNLRTTPPVAPPSVRPHLTENILKQSRHQYSNVLKLNPTASATIFIFIPASIIPMARPLTSKLNSFSLQDITFKGNVFCCEHESAHLYCRYLCTLRTKIVSQERKVLVW